MLAVTLSILLWWAYFGRLAGAGEHALEGRSDAARVVLALDAYTFVHLAIVAGVILAALGVEEAMAHIGDAEPFGWFGASALAAGLALYTAATAVFGRLVDVGWSATRIIGALVLAASVPLLAAVAPMWALVVVGRRARRDARRRGPRRIGRRAASRTIPNRRHPERGDGPPARRGSTVWPPFLG